MVREADRRASRPRQRAPHGFTLIEVVAALAIFSIMMVSLSTLAVATIHANDQARRVTAATNLARDKFEELRNTAYSNLAGGSDVPLHENGQSTGIGATYTRSWTVTSGPTAKTKEITVTVQWTDRAARQVTLRTVAGE